MHRKILFTSKQLTFLLSAHFFLSLSLSLSLPSLLLSLIAISHLCSFPCASLHSSHSSLLSVHGITAPLSLRLSLALCNTHSASTTPTFNLHCHLKPQSLRSPMKFPKFPEVTENKSEILSQARPPTNGSRTRWCTNQWCNHHVFEFMAESNARSRLLIWSEI
jgi:hypothetical protein